MNLHMASSRQQVIEDDIISHCGSISGETFSSRRRKNACSLRQHSIDSLAKRLREFPFDKDVDRSCVQRSESNVPKRPRFNKIFHHYRFIVTMLGGFSVGTMFLLRYNITVSILRMVNHTHLYMEEHPDRTVEDFLAEGYSPGGEFNWNNEIQHMIMSWYMIAYTLPQVPCTKLAMMLGSRWAIPISLTVCSIATLLTPTFAYFGWEWVLVLRLINGLGGTAVLPLLLSIVENWMPYDEITVGLSLAQTLTTILLATNPLITGYLSAIHWSYSFYVPGICALIFSIVWLILVSDRPEDNFFISEKELEHICDCKIAPSGCSERNKQQVATNMINDEDDSEYKPDSWVQIFKVPSFYAYILIWCFYCSSYSGFSFILPTYLRQFLKIKVAQNGLYCFIIQSGCIVSTIWPHPVLKLLQNKLGFTNTTARRLTHILLCSIVASTWIYVGFFHESQLILLFLNRCAHNSNDIVVTGCLMSNYAKAGLSSIAFSMVNTVGNLSVVFVSTFIGWLLDYSAQSREGWCWIFSGLGIAQMVMLLAFVTFITPDPIKFKNKPKSLRVMSQNMASNMQVLVNNDKKNGILNNFDKLRDTTTTTANNNMSDLSIEPGHNESRQI